MLSLHEIVRKARSIPLPSVAGSRVPERWRFGGCGHDQFVRSCRQCVNIKVDGVAASGQISDQGVVAHRERWDDTVDALVAPAPIVLGIVVQRQHGRFLLPWRK